MAIIETSSPGRGGIIGNPSDIYGGTVVSCTIPFRAHARVEPSSQFEFDIGGQYAVLQGPDPFAPDDHYWFHQLPKAVMRYLLSDDFPWREQIDPARTFKLTADSDVPRQAGCSGSTTILVSILAAILEFFEVHLPRHELAEQAHNIEHHVMKVACGYQDQYMTIFGGLNCVDLRDKAAEQTDGQAPYASVEALTDLVPELPFVLAHTGVKRASNSVHSEQRRRYENGDPEVIAGFARVGELGRLGKRALLRGDWAELGRLMNANHEITRELKGSGEHNEALIKAALDHGALGAKLSGAGRGGTIIALHEDPDWLGERLKEAGAALIMRLVPVPGLQVHRLD